MKTRTCTKCGYKPPKTSRITIQPAFPIPLSEEYVGDEGVFENADKRVLDSGFQLKIDYPIKKSRRKKAAK
ncbi:MAG: hypothetical protein IPI78_06640 [Chitinophagaceae bacterium]|nr:hypothetical protein [Chitinophagaceae bacterium]